MNVLKNTVKHLRKKLENGELKNWWINRKHTEETKKRISETLKKYLLENPEKVPYKLNHSSNRVFLKNSLKLFL